MQQSLAERASTRTRHTVSSSSHKFSPQTATSSADGSDEGVTATAKVTDSPQSSPTSTEPAVKVVQRKPPTTFFRPWLDNGATDARLNGVDVKPAATGAGRTPPPEPSSDEDAAHVDQRLLSMEQLATNMGKSAFGGHRCIYCGKMYSRK
jgi:hypothetical protein